MLAIVTEAWPWQGAVGGLFAADEQVRAEAVVSAAHNVLLPRQDRETKVRQAMREMASFIFVYGVE